jgi:hypothetical protein
MATRRNKRTKRTRRGSGKRFTQPMRNLGFDIFGPSTSKLAKQIHTLFDTDLDIPSEEKIKHLRRILEKNKNVNQYNLIENLKDLGMGEYSKEMIEIKDELEYTLPKQKDEPSYNT